MAMNQPKVLIVSSVKPDAFEAQSTGMGLFMQTLYDELKRRDYPFKLCVLQQNRDGSTTYSVCGEVEGEAESTTTINPALPLNNCFESQAINSAWTLRNALKPLLAAFQPDVISVHDSALFMPFYFMAGKVQVTLHNRSLGLAHELDRTHAGMLHYWEQKIAASKASAMVLHSQQAYDHLRDQVLKTAPPKQQTSIFNIGLDAANYIAKKTPHSHGKIRVSYIGSLLDPLQNFSVFAKTIALLPQACRDLMVTKVYTQEDYLSIIPEGMKNTQFKDIEFKSVNHFEDKKLALSNTDILLISSSHESFGTLGLEAMLSNCKVIASQGTGMDSYLEPGSVSPCEPTSMALKLEADLHQWTATQQKQANNDYRQLVDSPRFSATQMVDNYTTAWLNLAKIS